MRRQSKVCIEWSPAFSYAIGLIASDGNFTKDGRIINFTSKDEELVDTFKRCLNVENKIGRKARGGEAEKKYFVIQIGDRNFHDYLGSIGLTPAKSRTIGPLKIPDNVFADFLRGCIDGDGTIGTFNHPETKRPQVRLRLASASRPFLDWVHAKVKVLFSIQGGWITATSGRSGKVCFYLCFGKTDSIHLLKFLYYDDVQFFLSRKLLIVKKLLRTHAGVV